MIVRAARAISLSTVKVFCIIAVDYDEIPHLSSAFAVGCLLLVHVKSDVGSRVILRRSKRRDVTFVILLVTRLTMTK